MRVNFLNLVWIMVAMAIVQGLLLHHRWLGGASLVMAVVLFFVHRRRVRKFKEYDQSRTFD